MRFASASARDRGNPSHPHRFLPNFVTDTITNRPPLGAWIWFVLQLVAIAGLELGDDIFRGNIDPPDVQEAVLHARQVVHFEQSHGFFVEPALQIWLRHAHSLFGLLSFTSVVHITDFIYAVGQTLVPISVAIWIFLKHRSHFALVRNITLLSTLLALVGYELYPLAPPRLTTGLIYQHHIFHFQDTVQHVIGDGKLNSVPIAYNAYSAMPSLHMAWALILAVSVILLTHTLLVRVLAGAYPLVMLFTVVVSANHYLLDAAGAALVVALATVIMLSLDSARAHLHGVRRAIWQRLLRFPAAPQLATTARKVTGRHLTMADSPHQRSRRIGPCPPRGAPGPSLELAVRLDWDTAKPRGAWVKRAHGVGARHR